MAKKILCGGGLMERHPNFSQTLKELLCQQKVSITHQNSGMSGIAAQRVSDAITKAIPYRVALIMAYTLHGIT
ncbi:hypothetical protein C2C55_003018 [Escherichia coli]|nr:hypothetical protein [Escherichia coli]